MADITILNDIFDANTTLLNTERFANRLDLQVKNHHGNLINSTTNAQGIEERIYELPNPGTIILRRLKENTRWPLVINFNSEHYTASAYAILSGFEKTRMYESLKKQIDALAEEIMRP